MAALLKEKLGLELSETKTLVTPVTEAFAFLGHHVRVRDNRAFQADMACVTLIPKERSHRLRERIKRLCRRNRTGQSLHDLLRDLNWLLRGWSAFYRHAWGAKRVFCSLDYYAWWTVFRWLRKKHQHAPVKALKAMYPPSKERGIAPGTVAPSWGHAVRHRADPGRTLPAGLGPPASLRDPSWRAGCITKGACPVRKGAPGNLPARAGKAPGAHLTRRAISLWHVVAAHAREAVGEDATAQVLGELALDVARKATTIGVAQLGEHRLRVA